jgi:hypothetical protein
MSGPFLKSGQKTQAHCAELRDIGSVIHTYLIPCRNKSGLGEFNLGLRKSWTDFYLSRRNDLLEQIEKFKQSPAHRVSHGRGHGTEVTAEQLVVPSEHVVDENIAVSIQPAESGRYAHAEGERVVVDDPGRQR